MGTDNPRLLNDEMYISNRHARVRDALTRRIHVVPFSEAFHHVQHYSHDDPAARSRPPRTDNHYP